VVGRGQRLYPDGAACAIDRVLTRIDAHALDTAVCAYLADRHCAATEDSDEDTRPAHEAIAVDGKALKGSDRTSNWSPSTATATEPSC
jgi:hypothetical protein